MRPPLHRFELGGRVVEACYPGAAHTVDNAVAFDRGSKVLFGGCMMRALEARNLGNVADADLARWGGTVARVAERYLDPALIVPGHGVPGDRSIYAHTIALTTG